MEKTPEIKTNDAGTVTTHLAQALPMAVPGAEGAAAPEWIQIFPAGPELAAVDGRSFRMSDPAAFVSAQLAAKAMPILVDFDHLSAFAPDEGGDQTAAGWIEELEVREGQVWARVAWTVRAAEQIADRQWRFVSPEFKASKKTGEVIRLDAVALVNRPAFQMTALASAQKSDNGETPMKAIATALGLPEDATEPQILAAIDEAKGELASARASATPSVKDYMPRADYDHVLARAESAEAELASATTARRAAEIEEMVDQAVTASKITPASRDRFVALASASDAGFEEVKALCAELPKITGVSDLDETGGAPGASLTEDQREICATLGVSEEDYLAQLARDQS